MLEDIQKIVYSLTSCLYCQILKGYTKILVTLALGVAPGLQ